MKYAKNLLETLGSTPLVRLSAFHRATNPTVLAKLEYFNPGGSVKDRIGIYMIEDAEKKGILKKGGIIVEPTGGNTGVGLAIAAAIKGYKVIFTLSERTSLEKERVLRAYGAEIIRCPMHVGIDDPRHYINVCKRIAKERQAFFPNQYDNPANIRAHYETTGPEIWNDTEGKVTHFVAVLGSGGTISGVGKYLKEKNPRIKIIGVDVKGSMLHHYYNHTKGKPGSYQIEGPGQSFMPNALKFDVIDEIIVGSEKQAYLAARKLVKSDGIFVGGSSGLALYGAVQVTKKLSSTDVVVVIFPDSGRSYISKFYDDEWMKKNIQ